MKFRKCKIRKIDVLPRARTFRKIGRRTCCFVEVVSRNIMQSRYAAHNGIARNGITFEADESRLL